MIIRKREARIYATENGRSPFTDWLDGLRDVRGKAAVLVRIRRMEEGNLGHWRSVGQGVHEMKIHLGPGYRVYFGMDGDHLVILLCGGDKGTQSRDVWKAQTYWADYRGRQ